MLYFAIEIHLKMLCEVCQFILVISKFSTPCPSPKKTMKHALGFHSFITIKSRINIDIVQQV